MDREARELADAIAATKRTHAAETAAFAERLAAEDAEQVRIATERALAK